MTPWSQERPSKEGWYWYRSLLGDLEVVKIGRVGHALMIYGHGYGDGATLCYQGDGEWQGPLEPKE